MAGTHTTPNARPETAERSPILQAPLARNMGPLAAALSKDAASVVAEAIRDAYLTGQPIPPVRERLPEADIEAAYAVQEINTAHWIGEKRRLVGRKIGLTSPAVQRQLGVGQPDFGMLFADMAVAEGLPIPVSRILQPKIEAELALVLKRDLDVEDPTLVDVILATDYVLPALEIVGSRIADWNIRIVDTIADNASSGLFVLGGPLRRLEGLELRAFRMTMTRDGEVVSQGAGSACLGHPINAAVWLAGEVARRGRPLLAGDIVLTGALGPMVPVSAGQRFEAVLDGIGTVSAEFVA